MVYFYLDGVLMTALDMGQGSGKAGYRVYAATAQMDDLKVYELERPQADKAALQALVERCTAYAAQDYTEESFAALQTSLNQAKAVLEDPFASQSAVDLATENLAAAEAALVLRDSGAAPVYPVRTEQAEHGTLTISPRYPMLGQTVTIIPEPEKGYVLSQLTVADQNGKAVAVTERADGSWSWCSPWAA